MGKAAFKQNNMGLIKLKKIAFLNSDLKHCWFSNICSSRVRYVEYRENRVKYSFVSKLKHLTFLPT